MTTETRKGIVAKHDHPNPRGSFLLMKLREADSFIQAGIYEAARMSINEAIAYQKRAMESSSSSQDSLRAAIEARIKETQDAKHLASMKKLLEVDGGEAVKEWEYLKDPLLQLNWVLYCMEAGIEP